MLKVLTPEEALKLIEREFPCCGAGVERVPLAAAPGRVLAEDVSAAEYVPGFHRSTVDGYALRAADTFGCSDAIPAILEVAARVLMGESAEVALSEGQCCAVPTGGALPEGADSVVMIEYTEDYGDGTVGIGKAAAPGQNVILKGEDVFPGKVILHRGRRLSGADIGALAAIGRTEAPVAMRPRVGIISTGDELVRPGDIPGPGQMRDVNGPMLAAMLTAFGAEPVSCGIVRDDEPALRAAVSRAVEECDAVLLSGGSSVGEKDAAARVISALGELLMHGLAMKPGKPTMLGKVQGKPVLGLPGHPVAAYFVARAVAMPLLGGLMGLSMPRYTVTAELGESVGANHGREQYLCVRLERREGRLMACPIRGKSGLITNLAGADGYFAIPRDCEGLPRGAEIQVTLCGEA